jgi:hypothetical protein
MVRGRSGQTGAGAGIGKGNVDVREKLQVQKFITVFVTILRRQYDMIRLSMRGTSTWVVETFSLK